MEQNREKAREKDLTLAWEKPSGDRMHAVATYRQHGNTPLWDTPMKEVSTTYVNKC